MKGIFKKETYKYLETEDDKLEEIEIDILHPTDEDETEALIEARIVVLVQTMGGPRPAPFGLKMSADDIGGHNIETVLSAVKKQVEVVFPQLQQQANAAELQASRTTMPASDGNAGLRLV